MYRVLVCDDDDLVRDSVADQLAFDGYSVVTAHDGAKALELVESAPVDAVLLDLMMPRMDGLGVLRELSRAHADLPVIVMTGHGDVESAIEATRLGARAYLSKPIEPAELTVQLRRAIDVVHRDGQGSYGPLIGTSPAMRTVFDILSRLEKVDAPTVLICGETGTGKDVVARALHTRGRRRDKPFLAIDCASLTETLIESELFGHERGSFTDAHQVKRGLFELARGGVIFLDEIGEMAPSTQAKLLRAIESRSFRRVGGVVDIALDAAIIVATNRDLREEVKAGRFREDLFFRLNVVPIEIPPLRRRPSDVGPLALHLVRKVSAELSRSIAGITPDALSVLAQHPWPGNVRELRNVLERAVILKREDRAVDVGDLPRDIVEQLGDGRRSTGFELPPEGIDLAELERDLLEQALARARGNQTAAARLLGITRFALRYRLDKHNAFKPKG